MYYAVIIDIHTHFCMHDYGVLTTETSIWICICPCFLSFISYVYSGPDSKLIFNVFQIVLYPLFFASSSFNFLAWLSSTCDLCRESGEMCAMKEVTLFSDDPKSRECAQQLGQVSLPIKKLFLWANPRIVLDRVCVCVCLIMKGNDVCTTKICCQV
jgi:hypothetical protein